MKKFTNPLNDIKIASPCSADWNEMIGDDRQRHCAECQLNVFNLSDMTQIEAENFLINSEGRVCVTFYRRSDGTVLMNDCPVGWQRLKKNVSRFAAAALSIVSGFSVGVLGLETLKSLRKLTNYKEVPAIFFQKAKEKTYEESKGKLSFGGGLSNLAEIKIKILKNQD